MKTPSSLCLSIATRVSSDIIDSLFDTSSAPAVYLDDILMSSKTKEDH